MGLKPQGTQQQAFQGSFEAHQAWPRRCPAASRTAKKAPAGIPETPSGRCAARIQAYETVNSIIEY